MVRTREELIERFNAIVGENTDDNVLEFLEDLTDSLNTDNYYTLEDINEAVNEMDMTWRERYKKRFYSGTDEAVEITENNEEFKSYNDLFREV